MEHTRIKLLGLKTIMWKEWSREIGIGGKNCNYIIGGDKSIVWDSCN
jgi:hypothetical protein